MSHAGWYAARAAGLLAWLMLSASVALGMLLATRRRGARVCRGSLRSLHRDLSLLSLALVAVHVAGLVADNNVHFGLADVTIPLVAEWHPEAVAGGIVAAWILVAVSVTTALRHRLGPATWRAVHLASYLAYLLATLHLLGAGTDTAATPTRIAVLAVTGSIAVLALVALPGVRSPARDAVARAVARGPDGAAGFPNLTERSIGSVTWRSTEHQPS